MTSTQPILVDDGTPGVRVISLNRPQRLNAFDGQSLTDLIAALAECAQPERDIRVIVIRANGRTFCSGNDLKPLVSIKRGVDYKVKVRVK